jgi:dGTPase
MWKDNQKKYGAYSSEEEVFQFGRGIVPPGGGKARCIEAQIMDWADDITYSVHDTEDFYRAGLIPLERLAVNPKEREIFLQSAVNRWKQSEKPIPSERQILDVSDGFFGSMPIREPYRGTRRQQEALYEFTSKGINDYVSGTKLLPPPGTEGEGLGVAPEFLLQIDLLKELTWHYVINAPALASQQHGQRLAIRTLFYVFARAAESQKWSLFPALYRDEAIELNEKKQLDPARRARLVADTIAAMSDQQALRMYQRLSGLTREPALDGTLS